MLAFTATWATAVSGADAAPQHNPKGRFLGVVKSMRASARATPQAQVQAQAAAGDLKYHGGPVMHSNRTHAIYWEPSGFATTASYKSLINGFLSDVSADSGRHSNVYASDVQYTDGSGSAAYSSTFAGPVVVNDPYPASGCSDPGTTVCLTDGQIQAEVNQVVAANGLPRGLGDIYFVMTPHGVGSCEDSSSTVCAYTDYCAYHSSFGSGVGETLYANQPYADVPGCDSGQQPSGNVADSTINLISHEHNETITDPRGDAWFDVNGNENGDKCAWDFGSALGSTSSGQYNQLINSQHYYLQQEWSNLSHGCVLTMPNHAPTASFVSTPPSPTTGQAVSFDGSASSDSDGTIAGYSWTFGDGATGSGSKPSHVYAAAGTYTVKLTVTDNDGTTASVSHMVTVTVGADAPPSASFSFAPPSPTTGQSVAFDGSASSDPDGTVTGYSWDFGDGGTDSSGATPSHTYATAGAYTVILTVTDNSGSTGQVQHQLTVTQSSSGVAPGEGTTTGGGSTAGGPSPVFGPPTTSAGGGLSPQAGARVLIPSQRLHLSSSRGTSMRVRCGLRYRCIGTLGIYVAVRGGSARGSRLRTVRLGQARFSIPALGTVTVRLRLSRLATTLLRDHVRVRVRAKALVTRAASGSAAVERSLWLERVARSKR